MSACGASLRIHMSATGEKKAGPQMGGERAHQQNTEGHNKQTRDANRHPARSRGANFGRLQRPEMLCSVQTDSCVYLLCCV